MQTLLSRLNYAWRVLATGISFSVFGLGGMLIGIVAMPILLLCVRQRSRRRICAQYFIHRTFRWFIQLMQIMGVMRLHVEGLGKVRNSDAQLILANHPSLLDVVCLISILPQADCIVKQALWRNPFTRGPVQAADYILNNQSNQLIEDSVQRLEQHNKMIVFPEGTRTAKNSVLNEFQRGAAHIALNSHAAVIPTVIRCIPSTLSKNEAWYHIPPRRFEIWVAFQDALEMDIWRQSTETSSVQVRHFNRYLHDYFLRKLRNE